jgi:hypothetical protein
MSNVIKLETELDACERITSVAFDKLAAQVLLLLAGGGSRWELMKTVFEMNDCLKRQGVVDAMANDGVAGEPNFQIGFDPSPVGTDEVDDGDPDGPIALFAILQEAMKVTASMIDESVRPSDTALFDAISNYERVRETKIAGMSNEQRRAMMDRHK